MEIDKFLLFSSDSNKESDSEKEELNQQFSDQAAAQLQEAFARTRR